MTRRQAMTPRRAKILRYLIEYHQEHGIVPSSRELLRTHPAPPPLTSVCRSLPCPSARLTARRRRR